MLDRRVLQQQTKSWQNNLVAATKTLQKKWKLGKDPKEKKFYM